MKKDFIILAILGIGGLGIFLKLHRYADPSANVKFTKSRAEIRNICTEFLKDQGFDISGYMSSQIFSGDNFAALFIQKEVGLDSLNRLSQPENENFIPLWYWKLRWFKPQQKEEFLLSIATNGKIIGYQHLLREDAPGETLNTDSAMAIATRFLADKFGWRKSDWILVSSQSEEKKARRDYSFVWKSKILKIGDGEPRIEVDIAGDKISGFSYYLKVPEPFRRSYISRSSIGSLIAGFTFFLSLLLFAVGAFFVIRRLIQGQRFIKISLTAIFPLFIAGLFMTFNSFPQRLFSYQTETQYASFIFSLIFGAVLIGIGISALGGISLLTGYLLSDENEKRRFFVGLRDMAYGKFLNPHWISVVIFGYLIAFIFLGLDDIIYIVGRKVIGVWFPAGNRYTEAFGTIVPVLYPLSVSLIAGFWEEAFYRLAGFTILRKLKFPFFISVLVPTMLWAFAHSNYPVFPVWFRGVELTIGGLLFFLFFYRYGLLTVIFAHFMIDTVYMALPMVSAPVTTLKVQGIAALSIGIFPIILGLVSRNRKTFIPPELPKINPDMLKEILKNQVQSGSIPMDLLVNLAQSHGITKNQDIFYFILTELLGVNVSWKIESESVYMQVPNTHFVNDLAERLGLSYIIRENVLLVKYITQHFT